MAGMPVAPADDDSPPDEGGELFPSCPSPPPDAVISEGCDLGEVRVPVGAVDLTAEKGIC